MYVDLIQKNVFSLNKTIIIMWPCEERNVYFNSDCLTFFTCVQIVFSQKDILWKGANSLN